MFSPAAYCSLLTCIHSFLMLSRRPPHGLPWFHQAVVDNLVDCFSFTV